MATPIGNGDIVQVRVFCVQLEQVAINVLHYLASTFLGTGGTIEDAVVAFDSIYAPVYKALMSTNASYRGVGVKRLWPAPESYEILLNTGNGAGTATGDTLPRQTAGLITKRTRFSGVGYRGRIYAPFPAEGDNDGNGLPSSGYVTRLNNLGAAYAAQRTIGTLGNTTVLVPIVYHRNDHTGTTLETAFGRQRWATQRRRGSYGASNLPPI